VGTFKNVIPVPIFIGRIHPAFGGTDITGLLLEFIPYLIRGKSDKFGIIRGSLVMGTSSKCMEV